MVSYGLTIKPQRNVYDNSAEFARRSTVRPFVGLLLNTDVTNTEIEQEPSYLITLNHPLYPGNDPRHTGFFINYRCINPKNLLETLVPVSYGSNNTTVFRAVHEGTSFGFAIQYGLSFRDGHLDNASDIKSIFRYNNDYFLYLSVHLDDLTKYLIVYTCNYRDAHVYNTTILTDNNGNKIKLDKHNKSLLMAEDIAYTTINNERNRYLMLSFIKNSETSNDTNKLHVVHFPFSLFCPLGDCS
jgi:hypothetical protein